MRALRHTLAMAVVAAATVVVTTRSLGAADPLEVQVLQTSVESLYTNITLVKGRERAVLIDVPFTRADAHRVLADVLESRKVLETIFITHDHPDHFFSLEVLTDAFPEARVVAASQVVDDIRKSIPAKLERWGPMLGRNGPQRPVAPTSLTERHFELEGHRFEVLGPMQGDHVHATAVWIPAIKTLVAGDLLFNEMHLWLGETRQPDRLAWAKSVDRLAALGATRVVAGHKKPGLPDDTSAIVYTRRYLQVFEQAVGASKTSVELSARMRTAFPNTIDWMDFLLGNSAKVALGEIPPWQE